MVGLHKSVYLLIETRPRAGLLVGPKDDGSRHLRWRQAQSRCPSLRINPLDSCRTTYAKHMRRWRPAILVILLRQLPYS